MGNVPPASRAGATPNEGRHFDEQKPSAFLHLSTPTTASTMNRGSSPTAHISAAAAAHEGVRHFDPLAFNAAPVRGGNAGGAARGFGNGLPSSSGFNAGSDADGTNGYANGSSSVNGTPGGQLGGRRAGQDGPDMDTDPTPRSKGRPRNLQNVEEIPPVTDETGERVREGFRDFLQR